MNAISQEYDGAYNSDAPDGKIFVVQLHGDLSAFTRLNVGAFKASQDFWWLACALRVRQVELADLVAASTLAVGHGERGCRSLLPEPRWTANAAAVDLYILLYFLHLKVGVAERAVGQAEAKLIPRLDVVLIEMAV